MELLLARDFTRRIGAGLLWELARKLFVLCFHLHLLSNLVYGSVAAIIAILTWAYLSGHILPLLALT